MPAMLSPMEIYHAARETCVRLYVANGGNASDKWLIQPYPGTAAIAFAKSRWGEPNTWTLAMPAFPLDVRLPRWKADLIGAYTVHELLHALWTDWDAVAQSRRENLHSLVNALEDTRIEGKASRGELLMVHEARRLLVALNAHIARRAMTTTDFRLDDPKQFSFILSLVIFSEKLGYASEFPATWRANVRAEWLPLFALALSRYDALRSTGDCLQLARDLKALAASMPKRPSPPLSKPGQTATGNEGDGTAPHDLPPQPMPRSPEIVEPDNDGGDAEGGTGTGQAQGDADLPVDGQDAPEPPTPAPGLEGPPADKSEAPDSGDDATGGKPGEAGGRGGGRSEPEPEPEPEPGAELTDTTQRYEEANLDDMSAETAAEAGMDQLQITIAAMHAATIINVPDLREVEPGTGRGRGSNPAKAAELISSPAKLRRHLTLAVKSPERIGTERRQVSGRLDMRNLVGLATGAPNVFRRRIEEEGREAAVSLLLDISGSMAGARLAAAKAMALHMGDALKAAGVKFEIAGFDDMVIVRPKSFSEGWAPLTRARVAQMTVLNGTAILPAMKGAAERLLTVGNVTRRILLVLTDGQDSYADDANAALCAYYRQRGVEIVGIGLMTHSVVKPFAGKCVVVWNTSELSEKGLSALVKTLDAGAPRMG